MNKWIQHVKQWAAENGVTYSCAMSDEKCKYAYSKENPKVEKTKAKAKVIPDKKEKFKESVERGLMEDEDISLKGGALADWFSADSWSKYATAVTQGRKDYPPKMREIIEKYGNIPILRMYACRTPVSSLLTSALNAVSFGEFSKKWDNKPYDKLFHLDLRIELATRPQTTILLEKNEVLNAMVNPIPPGKNTQCSRIPKNKKITMLNLLEGAKKIQGDKFFRYSAYNNNCQDFIMAMLKGVEVGTQENFDFIKQDTKELFKGLPGTRKFANTVTDLGAIVNTITEGAGIRAKRPLVRGRGAEREPTPEELFQIIYENVVNQLWEMFPYASVIDIENGAMDLATRIFNGEEINLDDLLQEEEED
jgi:hypothetical protein